MASVHLQYGKDGLSVEIPSSNVTVLAPSFLAWLPDEAAAFQEAVREPIACRPLKDVIGARERVAVVIPDITRPLPTDRLLRWLFAELAHVPAENFTIVNGTGSHRVNTPAELAVMAGADIAAKYRIVMGFIEPHFMAGFSGGFKGIFPAVADIASIMRYHRAEVIGDPRSCWGLLDGNPTQEIVRRNGALLPVDFCINVTQNRKREITRFFCGEVMAAHTQGCAFAKSTAMVACARPFPIVVTTNGGYPLDQNLYQAVKGMHAAAQIVAQDGLIVAAARCNDGFPEHGNFKKLLFEHPSAQAVLDTILAPGFSMYDQWEAQLLALICLKARVGLFSEIPAGEVRRAYLEPLTDISARIATELQRLGADAPIAVLPEGPMTIPYLAGSTKDEGRSDEGQKAIANPSPDPSPC